MRLRRLALDPPYFIHKIHLFNHIIYVEKF
jgi:hypothetical protein